jgi:hypothetical protein
VVETDHWIAAGVGEGEVLGGKYRVERILGIGGMGVVVAAHHIQLDEKVAIKFLRPEGLADAESVARFSREARAAVRIKSEHVTRVTDVGTLPNGAPYMVMEYLEGVDLAAWLRQRGPLPVEQAVEFVLQACVAVADAHAQGIVHRDLKPANLYCVRRSDGQLTIKVLDFGISKGGDAHGGPGMSATKTGSVMGSPLYMSPEQMRSTKDVDAHTDIWALGIILFELLTGQPPFNGETLPDVAIKVATERAPSLRSFRPDAPPGLEAAIYRCLEKDRRARFRDVAEFAVALVGFGPARARASVDRISGILGSAGFAPRAFEMPVALPPGAPTMLAPGTDAPVGRTAAPAERSKSTTRVAVTVGVIAVAVASTVGVLMTRGRAQPDLASQAAAAPSASELPARSVAPSVSAPVEPPVAVAPAPAPMAPPAISEPTPALPVPPSIKHRAVAPDTGPPHPPSPSPSASAAGKTANCTPPFFVDEAGHKRYKPECFE